MEDNMFAALPGHIGSQILIRQEDHGISFKRLDHRDCIAGGAANVTLRFYIGIGVDIGDDRHAGEFSPKSAHILGGDTGGERTTGFGRRKKDRFARVQILASRP